MKKINLAITGCMGRMGQQIIKSAKSDKNFKIVAVTENRIVNKKVAGVKPSLNTEEAFKKANLIIDFTVPKCTFEVLKIASKLKKRVVIGTTGFSKKEENLIKKYGRKIPILRAGNMSLGINLLMYLTEIASKSLGNNFLSKVFEIHHKHKKDPPSGTALMLGKGIAVGKNKDFYKFIPKLIFPALSIGIFLEYFLIKFSSFFENPVVPITTLFFNFDAIFKTSNVHLGTVKSIIKFTFLKACSVFKLGLIPATFLLTILFSVRAIILKFLSDLADLIIC